MGYLCVWLLLSANKAALRVATDLDLESTALRTMTIEGAIALTFARRDAALHDAVAELVAALRAVFAAAASGGRRQPVNRRGHGSGHVDRRGGNRGDGNGNGRGGSDSSSVHALRHISTSLIVTTTAVVSPGPGTPVDVITATAEINGEPVPIGESRLRSGQVRRTSYAVVAITSTGVHGCPRLCCHYKTSACVTERGSRMRCWTSATISVAIAAVTCSTVHITATTTAAVNRLSPEYKCPATHGPLVISCLLV